jgi:hypothetical protein
MNAPAQTLKTKSHKAIALTAAASVIATLGLMATTAKPSLADEFVPGHYGPYGGWVRGHYV